MKNKTINACTLALAVMLVTQMPLAEEPDTRPVVRFAVYSVDNSAGTRAGIAIDTRGHVYEWHSTHAANPLGCEPYAIVNFEYSDSVSSLATQAQHSMEIADIGKFERLANLAIQDDPEPGESPYLICADCGYRCFAYFEDVPSSNYKKRYLLAATGGPFFDPGNDEGKQLVNWLEGIFRKVNPEARLYAPE